MPGRFRLIAVVLLAVFISLSGAATAKAELRQGGEAWEYFLEPGDDNLYVCVQSVTSFTKHLSERTIPFITGTAYRLMLVDGICPVSACFTRNGQDQGKGFVVMGAEKEENITVLVVALTDANNYNKTHKIEMLEINGCGGGFVFHAAPK